MTQNAVLLNTVKTRSSNIVLIQCCTWYWLAFSLWHSQNIFFIAWLLILSVIGQKFPAALFLPKTIGKALTVATSCCIDSWFVHFLYLCWFYGTWLKGVCLEYEYLRRFSFFFLGAFCTDFIRLFVKSPRHLSLVTSCFALVFVKLLLLLRSRFSVENRCRHVPYLLD